MRTVPTPAAREHILAQFRYYALDQGAPDVGAPQHFETPALAGVRAWPVPSFEDNRL